MHYHRFFPMLRSFFFTPVVLRIGGDTCVLAPSPPRCADWSPVLRAIERHCTRTDLDALVPWAPSPAAAVVEIGRELERGALQWLSLGRGGGSELTSSALDGPMRILTERGSGFLLRRRHTIEALGTDGVAQIVNRSLEDAGNVAALCNGTPSLGEDVEHLRARLIAALREGDARLVRIRSAPRVLDAPPMTDLLELVQGEGAAPRVEQGREPPVIDDVAPEAVVLRLRLVAREALTDEPYVLTVGPNVYEGTTDAEAMLEHALMPGWTAAELWLPERNEVYALQLQPLVPATERHGAAQRLTNLGWHPTPARSGDGEALQQSLQRFQYEHGLAATGELDGGTAAALQEAHGS